jgi:wyosine [tRNA(Phe)-imidazoG37] synthetase (radical SAM superfamily)
MGMIYGPVLSRRFGYSLGIDIIPFKICTYDCIYCQLGKTTDKTTERKQYINIDMGSFLKSLKSVIEDVKKIDYITFSGSGEPTLNTDIGILINKIKQLTDIPVAVLTNGSLLYRKEVVEALKDADLIKVSFDAPDERCFRSINRPSPIIIFEKILKGLKLLLNNFNGKIWLEVMIIKNINDGIEQAEQFKKVIYDIDKVSRDIDKIHLNTPVRPSEPGEVLIPDNSRLKEIKDILGEKVEIIKYKRSKFKELLNSKLEKEIVGLVRRRPVSAKEIGSSLQVNINQVIKCLKDLTDQGRIKLRSYRNKNYYYL